ncbi:MAG: shikimate kinase [Vulcanimicrobiota bacterium]
MPRNNLYLVGFMGTGKTTIGRELAKAMGRKFLDTDQVLESRFSKSVNEIFAEDGEAAFRAAERELSLELSATENRVIGTGGGTIMDPVNLEAFEKSGLLLRLYTTQTSLIGRLKRTSKRPLLAGETEEEVEEKIKKLLAEREEVYSKINLRLETTDLTPLIAARKVHEFLRSRPELFTEKLTSRVELR